MNQCDAGPNGPNTGGSVNADGRSTADQLPRLSRLRDLARQRAEEGNRQGRDPQPWRDLQRPFLLGEAAPELADAINYLDWDQAQAEQLGESSGAYRTEITLARLHIERAYQHLVDAHRARQTQRPPVFEGGPGSTPAGGGHADAETD